MFYTRGYIYQIIATVHISVVTVAQKGTQTQYPVPTTHSQ